MKVLNLLVTLFILSEHKVIAYDPLTPLNFARTTAANIYNISTNIFATLDRAELVKYGDKRIESVKDKRFQILNKFKPILEEIAQADKQYKQIEKASQSILGFVIRKIPLKLDDFINNISWTVNGYERMLDFEKTNYGFEKDTLISFSNWATSVTLDRPLDVMRRVHSILFDPDSNLSSSENIISVVTHKYEEFNKMCRENQSAQQFVYNFYSEIALCELKVHTMIELAYNMFRVFGQGNYTGDEQLMYTKYLERSDQALIEIRKVMKGADRSVWRCDPKEHVDKVSYDQVTRLLQGYIENEVDMHESGSCTSDCAAFERTVSKGCYGGFCEQQTKCSGELHSCRFIESDMSVCQAPSSSYRRYEYIDYADGPLLGEYQSCVGGSTKVESWRRWIFWQCSYCFCLCDEQSEKSDRYFNLRETLSDVQQNKVVTGVRFIKMNRIFHLQIQQGILLSNGNMDAYSVDWKPVDEYRLEDEHVINGVDYHTLSYASRSIDLDTHLKANETGFVITGVRFRLLRSHLNLMVRFSKFDFVTGRLLEPEVNSEWQSNDSDNRQQLILHELDVPTRTIAESMPLSKPNEYLQFVNSGASKDAAQSTVPFIDIQDVMSNPPVPLAGLGIYYKTSPGFGGFIAPKIITYDYTSHV